MARLGPEFNNTAPGGALPQQALAPPQDQHQAIAFGQTVGPLPFHPICAPPSQLLPLTMTQPSSLRERSCGQTMKLYSSEPLAQQTGVLKFGEVTAIQAPGFVGSVCKIHNLHHRNPLLKALHESLNHDVEIQREGDGVTIIAARFPGDFARDLNLPAFCGFVQSLRGSNIDDEAIAYLIGKGVKLQSNSLIITADEIGAGGIRLLINDGHHDLAGVLLAAIGGKAQSLPNSIYDDLYANLTQRGMDPQAFGIPPTYAGNDFTNLRALFCIDLCRGTMLDPVQAARIVVRNLVETRKPLPYQQEVMKCLCSLIETPEQANRALLAVAGNEHCKLLEVNQWLAPLFQLPDAWLIRSFMDAWERLIGLKTLELEPLQFGEDHAAMGFMKFQPVGGQQLDDGTIKHLKAVIETGARTEVGLTAAVAAFELLARDAGDNPSDQVRSELLNLRQELLNAVSTNPFPSLSSRSDEVEKRLNSALKL